MSALAFARTVLARWDRRVVAPRPLGVVFARPPAHDAPARGATVLQTLTHHTTHVALQPRIALTVLRPATVSEVVAPASAAAPAAAPDAVTARVEPLVLRAASALGAARVLDRVLTRARREEVLVREPSGAVGVAPPLARGYAGRELGPPVRTFAEPIVRRAPREAPDDPTPPALRVPGADPAREAARDAVDVGRLTDQVVAAIDHRLIAHAERLGRP